MRSRVTVAPTALACSIAKVKDHLCVSTDADDALIKRFLAAAVKQAEARLHRQLLQATRELTLDGWPGRFCSVELPRPPLQSVESVVYLDTDGVTQTLSEDAYLVDNAGYPGSAKVYPLSDDGWPEVKAGRPNVITITYVCGWEQADDPDDATNPQIAALPENLVSWLLLKVGDLYENREGVIVGQSLDVSALPRSFVDGLIDDLECPETL